LPALLFYPSAAIFTLKNIRLFEQSWMGIALYWWDIPRNAFSWLFNKLIINTQLNKLAAPIMDVCLKYGDLAVGLIPIKPIILR
jgi:hypothetical protein